MEKSTKMWIVLLSCICVMGIHSVAKAQKALRFSCSSQVFNALAKEQVAAFTKETGIEVDLYVSCSAVAVSRLMNKLSDIASTTKELHWGQLELGYHEIPICRDPLAVIVNSQCPVNNITETQLKKIFSKDITNWSEVGGPDQPIIVFVPGKNTAAYKNFDRAVMKRNRMRHDFMSYESTKVINAIERFPWGISVIGQGSVKDSNNIKSIKIDGRTPKDEDYPYTQMFYYITAGQPSGIVKRFIEFTKSEKGKALMRRNGMVPVLD